METDYKRIKTTLDDLTEKYNKLKQENSELFKNFKFIKDKNELEKVNIEWILLR